MSIKILSTFFFSGLFFVQQASAVDSSFDEKTIYLRAAAAFNQIMSGHSEINVQKLAKEDLALLELAKKNRNSDVKVEFSESMIRIESPTMGVTLELKNNDLYINGIKHKYNPALSRVENIRNWAKVYKRDHKTKSAHLFSLGISQALAADSVSLGTPAAMSIEKVNTFADKALGVAEGVAGAGTFVGGSAAVGAVSSAAGIFTGFMVGGLVAFDLITCEAMARGNSFGNLNRERLNCYTAGLSMIGLNPRDRLYLQGIRCEGSQIVVDLESQRNDRATRVFKFANGGSLASVEESRQLSPYSEKRENKAVRFSTPPNKNQKDLLAALQPELNYYQSLCKSPDTLAKFTREAAAAHAQKNIITTKPAGTK